MQTSLMLPEAHSAPAPEVQLSVKLLDKIVSQHDVMTTNEPIETKKYTSFEFVY